MSAWSRRIALCLLLAAASCARCHKGEAGAQAKLERFLPRSAQLVVIIPDPGVLGPRIAQLEKLKLASFLAQIVGFGDAHALVESFVAQVGIDVRSPEAMRKAGLDPSRPIGVAALENQHAVTVLPLSNPGTFTETLAKLAKQRLGAGIKNTQKVQGHERVSFARIGTHPELAYVLEPGWALVAPGEAVAELDQVAELAQEQSLQDDAALLGGLGRLGGQRDVVLYAPASGHGAPVPVVAQASVEKNGVHVRFDVPGSAAPDAKNALQKKGSAQVDRLPDDAFLVAEYAGDPATLTPLWTLLGNRIGVGRTFERANVDVPSQLFGNVEAGVAMSLSLSPRAQLGQGMPALDVQKTNPFQYAQLVVLARPKDSEKAQVLLDRMPTIAPTFGAQVQKASEQGRDVYKTSYAQGEGVDFALSHDGKTVVFASPLPRLFEGLARVEGNADKPPHALTDPELAKLLGERPAALVLDLRELSEAVKALPSEAWGIGGFAIKASAVRWLDATSELKALTLSAWEKDGAVQAELWLELAAP